MAGKPRVLSDSEMFPDAAIRPSGPLSDEEMHAGVAATGEEDPNALVEFGRGVGRGVVQRIPQGVGGLLKSAGFEEAGESVVEFGEENLERFPSLKEPEAVSRQRAEGPFELDPASSEAGESMGVSAGGAAAGAAAGAAVGSVVPGIGTAVGAVVGGTLGFFANIPIYFGLGYDETYEAVKKDQLSKGVSPEIAEQQAHEAGLASGAIEGGGEALFDIATVRLGKLVPGASTLTKNAVKQMASRYVRSPGKLAKGLATIVATETATEMAQTAGQLEVEAAYGLGEGATIEDVKRVILPSVIMSLASFGLAESVGTARRYRMVQDLKNPGAPVENRAKAIMDVANHLRAQDPELANAWLKSATQNLKEGKPIIAQDDEAYMAQQEIDAAIAEQEAVVEPATEAATEVPVTGATPAPGDGDKGPEEEAEVIEQPATEEVAEEVEETPAAEVEETPAAAFQPTHELPDGTPVIPGDEDLVWVDEKGEEYVEPSATPLAATPAEKPQAGEESPGDVEVASGEQGQPEAASAQTMVDQEKADLEAVAAEGDVVIEAPDRTDAEIKAIGEKVDRANEQLSLFATEEPSVTSKKEVESIQDPATRVSRYSAEREIADLERRGLGRIEAAAPGKTLKEALRKRPVSLKGTKVSEPKDLALAAQLFRSPNMETHRTIYVKDGEVVGEAVISARLPGVTMAAEQGKSYEDYMAEAKALGADTIYSMHNHPTVNARASKGDIAVAREMHRVWGDMFGGEIILDSDEYGFIRPGKPGVEAPTGTEREHSGLHVGRDFIKGRRTYGKKALRESPILKEKVGDLNDAAVLAAQIEDATDNMALFSVQGGSVRGLMEVDRQGLDLTTQRGRFKAAAFIRKFMRATGGQDVYLVNAPEAWEDVLVEAIEKDLLQDAMIRGAGATLGEGLDITSNRGEYIAGRRAATTGRKVTQQDRLAGRARQREKTSAGKLKGAPEWVDSPAKLGALTRLITKLTREGEVGRFWYEKSGNKVWEMTGGNFEDAEKLTQLIAIYSPQAPIYHNWQDATRAYYMWKAGVPKEEFNVRPFGSAGRETLDDKATALLYDGRPWGGRKTNSFYLNLMTEIFEKVGQESPYGAVTVDMWVARAFGYTRDSIGGGGNQDTNDQYSFAEREMSDLAKRLGWTPHQVQAALWTAIKARHEMKGVKKATIVRSTKAGHSSYDPKTGRWKAPTKAAGKNAHRWIWREEAMKAKPTAQDLQAAAYDFEDAANAILGVVTWEATPGVTTGFATEASQSPWRWEYQRQVAKAMLDEDGNDVLARKLGVLRSESVESLGHWKDTIGPGYQTFVAAPSRKLSDTKTGKSTTVAKLAKEAAPGERGIELPAAVDRINLYNTVLALTLRQEGWAWHRPHYTTNVADSNGIEFDMGETISMEEAENLSAEMMSRNIEGIIVPYQYGTRVLNVSDGMTNIEFHKKTLEAYNAAGIRDSEKPRVFGTDTQLGMNDWRKNPNGEAYKRRIEEADPQGELRAWIRDDFAPRIDEVNRRFVSRYGWNDGRFEPNPAKNFEGETPRRRATTASPVPLGRLDQGPEAQREVYGRFGTLDPNTDTTEQLKFYDLSRAVDDPAVVQTFLDDFDYQVKYFAFHSDPEAGVEFTIPRLKKESYEKGTLWIYDPRVAHGSFKDEAYTRAWRAFHEAGHGISEPLMQSKYGDSRRYGRMGREMVGQRGKPPKRIDYTVEPLTLMQAQRAVEWEDVAFRTQRMLQEMYGIKVDESDFAREYNTNIGDAMYRVLTGDFGDPGEYGFTPNATEPNLKSVLRALERTEQLLARDQNREPSAGINLETWRPVTDEQLREAIEARLEVARQARGATERPGRGRAEEGVGGGRAEVEGELRAEDQDVGDSGVRAQREPTTLDEATHDVVAEELGDDVAPMFYDAYGTDSPFFQRWFRNSKIRKSDGTPRVLFRAAGRPADENYSFEFERLGTNTQFPASGLGIFMTHNREQAEPYGQHMHEVYARIERPYRMTLEEFTSFDTVEDAVAFRVNLMNQGYDGAYYLTPKVEGEERQSYIIAFSAPQVKFVDNDGTFDSSAYMQRDDMAREYRGKSDPLSKLVNEANPKRKTLREKVKGVLGEMKDGKRQAVFDRFNSIKEYEEALGITDAAESGYVSARMSQAVDSQLWVAMARAALKWTEGGNTVGFHEDGRGLMQILEPVKDQMHLWKAYMMARRSERLLKEGREQRVDAKMVKAGKALAEKYPHFVEVAQAWDQFNSQMLDFAEQAGVIDPESRKLWNESDYIPFYRIMPEGLGGPTAGGQGLQGIPGIKRLTGEDLPTNDIFENMIRNTAWLIEASVRNHAMQKIVDNFAAAGILYRANPGFKPAIIPTREVKKALDDPNSPLYEIRRAMEAAGVDVSAIPAEAWQGIQQMWSMTVPAGEDIVQMRRAGKSEYWHVPDPALLRSLTAVNPVQLGRWIELFRWPKRFLTGMVTADPTFMFANWLRDTGQAFVVSRDAKAPLLGAIRGTTASLGRKDDYYWQLAAAGGLFRSGHISAADPAATERVISRELRSAGWYGPGGVRRMVDAYMDMGSNIENANRMGVAIEKREAGGSMLEQAYEARDFLDFSMRGDSQLFMFLAETVPFMNARLQGLYRLGRGFRENPAAFAMKGAMIMAATVALWFLHKDDEEYQELNEYEKDLYWHFWVSDGEGGKTHLRLPKPFEVGMLFGSMPERLFDSMYSRGDDAAKVILERYAWMALETFNLVGIPQTLKPMIEQVANKNFFTGAPIVGLSLDRLDPEYQWTPYTHETSVALGRGLGLSPARIDHLLRAYTGTIGNYALSASDYVVRNLADFPVEPELRIDDVPFIQRFVRGTPAKNTRYGEEFYDLFKEADRASSTMKRLQQYGRLQEANEYLKENYSEIVASKMLRKAQRAASALTRQARVVYMSESMTPEEKRITLDTLNENRATIYRNAVEATRRILSR